MASNTIKIAYEISDNGTLQISKKNTEQLRKAIEDGTKASLLLSKGISDPKRKEALESQVKVAKELTAEINRTVTQSKAAAKALATIGGTTGTTMMAGATPGLERGTAAANMRGGSRDFARQAQGMGGLVHLYATFAANIWSVQAAYMALSNAFEQARMEKAAEMMSTSVGINMKTLAEDIRAVSGYAVDLKDALQFGALGTQVGLTTKQITGLVKAAKGAANVLGRDVNDSVNRMIRGTAKMEQEILDELGIFVRAKEAYKDYAKQLGYTSEEALTQSQRVKAYAETVIKAAEKYKEFADIEDPFSRMSATIKDAGRDLLNVVNTAITPFISSLSESGKLVEALILSGAAYLTKLALPTLKNFATAMFDNSALVAKAKIARENEIAAVTAQLENLQHASEKVDFAKFGKELNKSFNSALNEPAITKAIGTALSKGAENFNKNLSTSLQQAARGYMGQASKAEGLGNIEAQQKWIAQAELITKNEQEIINRVKERIAQDTELTAILNKQSLTLQEQVLLETKLASLQKESSLETVAGRRLARSTASTGIAEKVTAGGIGGILSMQAFKGIPEMFDESTKGLGKFSKGLVVLESIAKVAAKALTGLFSVFNWGLMAWLAWDLAISPLLNLLGLTTNKAQAAEESITAFSDSIDTATKTLEKHNTLLINNSGDLDILIKSYNSVATSVEGVTDTMLQSISDTTSAISGMTTLDRLGNWISGLWGGDIYDKLDTQNQKLKEYIGNLGGSSTLVDRLTQSQQSLAEAQKRVQTASETAKGSLFSQGITGQNARAEYVAAVEEQRKKSEEVLANQKAITDEMRRQKAAAEETSAILERFKTIQETGRIVDSLANYDPNKFVFKNADLKAANESLTSLVTTASQFAQISSDKPGILADLSDEAKNRLVDGMSNSVLSLSDNFKLLSTTVKDPAFLNAYKELVESFKALKESPSDPLALERLKSAATEMGNIQIAAQKTEIERDKTESQRQADISKANSERQRVLQKMAEWEKDAQTRMLNREKESLSLIQAKNKLLLDGQLFQEKANQEEEFAQQKLVLAQEKLLEQKKLEFELLKDSRFIKKGSAEEEKLKTMYKEQQKILEEQFNIKGQILNIDQILAQRTRTRLEYEKTINAEITRGITLATSRLEALNARGEISEGTYDQGKFNQALAKIEQDRLTAYMEAGIVNPDLQPGVVANSKATEKLKELAVAEEILRREKETTDILRTRKQILQELSNTEDLIASILEKQEGRGIYNIRLLEELTNTQLVKINKELEYAVNDPLKQQELQLKKLNLMYEAQLRMHEAMKRNFLTLTPGQMTQTVVNEAQMQLDKFRASMKDTVTGTFDAVYAGFDAGIEELTTKIMESSSIKLSDLVTTVRNAMAEEFRKMSAEQMKLGVRQIGASIWEAITGKPADIRSVEEKQLSALEQIARNTTVMAGTSTGVFSNKPSIFDYTSENGNGASYTLEGTKKILNENNEWVDDTTVAAKTVQSTITGTLGSFGSSILQTFSGIGNGLMGILNPILNIFGITGFAGMGGGSSGDILGGLGGLLGGLDFSSIGTAIGSTFGMEGIGGMLSGLFFAKGGVMTEYGPMQLAKYSKGGVADRPQVAIYGEGAKNEAYVPLPDNRSIPVTLSGASGGDNISFNIQVNDNSTVTTSQEGESSNKERQQGYQEFSKLIAQRVREEMVNQKRPGGLLYGG